MNPIDTLSRHVLDLHAQIPLTIGGRIERDRTITLVNTILVTLKREAANELLRVIYQAGIAERTQ